MSVLDLSPAPTSTDAHGDGAPNGENAEAVTAPRSLAERVAQPRRLLQAVKAMAVLEADLRTLLERAGNPSQVDSGTVAWASTLYRDLRDEVLELLDDAGRDDALDEKIGIPTLEENPTFSTLLLKVSQATRWVSVEEAWPTMYIASKAAAAQMDQHLAQLNGAAATGVAELLPTPGQRNNAYI